MEIEIMTAAEAKTAKLLAEEVEAMKHFPAIIEIISKDIEKAAKNEEYSVRYDINKQYTKRNIDEIDLQSFLILQPHIKEFFEKLGYSYSKWYYSDSTIHKTGKVYKVIIKW